MSQRKKRHFVYRNAAYSIRIRTANKTTNLSCGRSDMRAFNYRSLHARLVGHVSEGALVTQRSVERLISGMTAIIFPFITRMTAWIRFIYRRVPFLCDLWRVYRNSRQFEVPFLRSLVANQSIRHCGLARVLSVEESWTCLSAIRMQKCFQPRRQLHVLRMRPSFKPVPHPSLCINTPHCCWWLVHSSLNCCNLELISIDMHHDTVADRQQAPWRNDNASNHSDLM